MIRYAAASIRFTSSGDARNLERSYAFMMSVQKRANTSPAAKVGLGKSVAHTATTLPFFRL
jgi:hypothetical protein